MRLASEIFLRCLAIREDMGERGPCLLYDPCCGGAYHLSTLGFLYGERMHTILASDVDPEAVALARRNLNLLTSAGLERRVDEIREMLQAYGKASHAGALESALYLEQRLALQGNRPLDVKVFEADATDGKALARGLGRRMIDVVLTDVPYGWRSDWQVDGSTAVGTGGPLWHMLDALRGLLSSQSVIAVAADKGQTIAHRGYVRLERLRSGRRQVAILAPNA